MTTTSIKCPSKSIIYNTSRCACPTGQFLNSTTNSCSYFWGRSAIYTDTGVELDNSFGFSFPETIFSFDSIKKFTQSQAVFLEATLVMVASWLLFCFFLRFTKLEHHGTHNKWFRIRWWISRLDICFATRHWLDDRKVVVKRKTELGGAFSIASWMLFIGLFATLLYQIISKRTIEVHNVRATNAPDLASFTNNMEFNITTVIQYELFKLARTWYLSYRNPGFIDHRVAPLTDFVNYTCRNTSMGPTLTFKCSKCHLNRDYMYISWQFVDLPSTPATAVGFQFNLSAKDHADKKHVSFVSGTLKSGSTFDDRPVTFRGKDSNILKFNLFPRIYHNLHDLRLIQPLFHEFLPGSFFGETSQLQASLETSSDGLINTTLSISYLSSYIVEIESQNIMGPVNNLTNIQSMTCECDSINAETFNDRENKEKKPCEYRVKRLRNEDVTMRQIRNRLKAREHWDKLRKYVMYTWGCNTLDNDYKSTKQGSICTGFMIPSICGNGSLHGNKSSRKKLQNREDSVSFNRKVSIPSEKNSIAEHTFTQGVKPFIAESVLNSEERLLDSREEHPPKGEVLISSNDRKQHSVGFYEGGASKPQAYSCEDDDVIPIPPPLEFNAGSEVEMSDILKNLHRLHDYNVMLREKFLANQSLLHALASKSTSLTNG
ncbi:hypothetical protein NC653_031222 [Populus alba x Populus x berolinensis]|uniref:Uncharacterized protein n=1 Tax=Populus alba x Populus x berolinensis TaxID=444605 RepID=A0AAD6LXW3_9ROSI|nr:hypothetical protein NC653_031222 [Populus alba x Populus x berolinensis]